MQNRIITSFLFISLLFIQAFPQSKTLAQFAPEAWEISAKGHEFKMYKGKQALFLDNGVARLKGSQFRNGIIEFDINFEAGRKFLGVHFRITDPLNYEEFYLRAHQSGNPDATQYTPVMNRNAGWQLYHGEGYSKDYRYNFGEWIHVRMIVAEDRMDIFLNDMSQVFLHVYDLKHKAVSGKIGFGTFLGPAWYANLSYQEIEQPQFPSKAKELPPIAPEILQNWQSSGAFSEKDLQGVQKLDQLKAYTSATWSSLNQEFTGLVNLSQVSEVSPETNTVLVKAKIYSDKKQIKKLELAYSDRIVAFVNQKAIYAGQRNFRSRDYRYLGTIGFFDSIFVELEPGENEIVFAVSENMGGWGLNARWLDPSGLRPN